MQYLRLFVVFFCVGCHPQDMVLDVTFNPCEAIVLAPGADATSEEIASVDEAARYWNDVLHSRLSRTLDASAAEIPISFEKLFPALFGAYRDEEGKIEINRWLSDPHERAVTIAHELGHSFGLWHVEDSERVSVMNPANLEQPPTSEDAVAVVELWGECSLVEEEEPRSSVLAPERSRLAHPSPVPPRLP